MSSIPTVSLKPIVDGHPDGDAVVATALMPMLHEWGAFELVDHGIADATMDTCFAAARRFFTLPMEERLAIKVDKHNRGYVPMKQTHYPGNQPDLKESFNVGLGLTADDPDVLAGKPLYGVNRWPDLPGFRAEVEAYFDAVTALGHRLLGPLALCMKLSPDELRAKYKKPVAFMRLFHYPPGGDADAREFGAAEHKDYGFLTILAQDANGGLEVRSRAGDIVPVPPRAHSFIINVGDMLSEITGGYFASPLHRVINSSGKARYSIPFFFDPDFEAVFPAMPQVSAGEFLLSKFNKFYKHRQALAEA